MLSTYANTAFLNEFSSPLGHTFVRFAGASLLSAVTLGPVKTRRLLLGRQSSISVDKTLQQPPDDTQSGTKAYARCGLLLFAANYCNSISLSLTGITVTYVVKAAIPVFTVLICALGLGKAYPKAVYASLVPTVLGIALARYISPKR